MKEITILSGKGGTGKTSLTAALASIAGRAVFCDNDVDAPDLHLIMEPAIRETHHYPGGWTVAVDPAICQACDICLDYCRYHAIHSGINGKPEVNPYLCEGCRLCEKICPYGAIISTQRNNNYWFVSDTRFGTLVHAAMAPGEENSGKLVSEIRKRAKELAMEQQAELLINDGPPGIGCAAISSLAGTDLVLMVIEPTTSGLHDLRRLYDLIASFSVPAFAILNKYDISSTISEEIEEFLDKRSISLLGRIPFDRRMVLAMIRGRSILEYNDNLEVSKVIQSSWKKLISQS